MEILTKSRECDEAGNHQDGMEIELLLGTLRPGEAIAIEHHPEEGQHEDAHQQDRGQDDDQQVLAPRAAVPGIIRILLIAPARRREAQEIRNIERDFTAVTCSCVSSGSWDDERSGG